MCHVVNKKKLQIRWDTLYPERFTMHLLKWDYSTLGWQDIKQALKKRHKKFRSVPIISIFEKARLWQQQDLTRFREKIGKNNAKSAP